MDWLISATAYTVAPRLGVSRLAALCEGERIWGEVIVEGRMERSESEKKDLKSSSRHAYIQQASGGGGSQSHPRSRRRRNHSFPSPRLTRRVEVVRGW